MAEPLEYASPPAPAEFGERSRRLRRDFFVLLALLAGEVVLAFMVLPILSETAIVILATTIIGVTVLAALRTRLAMLLPRRAVKLLHAIRSQCLYCGHELRGIGSNRCPECGCVVPREAGELYVIAARQCLSESMGKIEHCISQLTDEQIWWRPREGQPGEMNSIANLMLHLAGNLRQWIISGVGGAKDVRNRPAEFADHSRKPAAEVLAKLRQTVSEADAVLAKLDAEQLVQPRRIQGYDTTVLTAAFGTVAHFRGHAQEIIHMTREQLGGA